MYKSLVVIFFLAFCWVDLSAQQFSHKIFLKNGSIIHGNVLINTIDTLKIESCCKNIFIFKQEEVLNIETENISPTRERLQNASASGIFNLNSFGLILGKSEAMDATGFSLRSQIGYQFSNYAGLSIGVGFEHFNIDMIPLFVGFKSELSKRENTPVLSCYYGYSFPMNKKLNKDNIDYTYAGGTCTGFDFGVISYRTSKRAFYLSAGYQYQHLTEESSNIWYNNSTSKNTYDLNKLVVKIGFLFR
jgi:hypothetical protein